MSGRVLVWFSCGAASAVAAKVAVERYGATRDVEVCYCDTSRDEDPDNQRFKADVERWIGRTVTVLRHPKYSTVEQVWDGEGYVAGIQGAACTRVLKREPREKYQRPGDAHVLGLTADEADRIAMFTARHPDLECLWLLAAVGIRKADCYKVLQSAGIRLPASYLLGFNTANCLHCCKGGMGYHNKMRRHYPEVFERRKEQWKRLGFRPFVREDGTRFGLDELTPEMGRDVPEPDIECGLFCGGFSDLVQLAVNGKGAS